MISTDLKTVFVECPLGTTETQRGETERRIEAKLPDGWRCIVLESGTRLAGQVQGPGDGDSYAFGQDATSIVSILKDAHKTARYVRSAMSGEKGSDAGLGWILLGQFGVDLHEMRRALEAVRSKIDPPRAFYMPLDSAPSGS